MILNTKKNSNPQLLLTIGTIGDRNNVKVFT